MLKKEIENGQIYIKVNFGLGSDIIIKAGKKIWEAECKDLCPHYWMSTGWIIRKVLSRFIYPNSTKFLISTYSHIWTDLDRELLKRERITLLTTGKKLGADFNKADYISLFKSQLIRLVKEIKKYLKRVRSSIESNQLSTNLLNNTLLDYVNKHNILSNKDIIKIKLLDLSIKERRKKAPRPHGGWRDVVVTMSNKRGVKMNAL